VGQSVSTTTGGRVRREGIIGLGLISFIWTVQTGR